MRGTARTSAWHPAQRSGELPRVGAPGGDAGAGADRLRLILDGVPGEKELFALSFRKMLFLFNENKGNELTAFYRAASLSNIYRFITQYHMTEGNLEIKERNQVAFFPGTFDPFTLSHKEIVREIRDRGYEVFLAVDEFSWSKKAQPHLIRRQM